MNSSVKLGAKLTEMEFYFTQYEVESKASDCLKFGDVDNIAAKAGVSPSLISQMYNPHEERKSNFYKCLKEICAELDNDQERGKALFCLFKSIVERHVKDEKPLSVNVELEKADKEFSDIWQARLRGKSPGEQITEIEQAQQQLQDLKRAVAKELHSEEKATIYDQNFGGLKEYPA